MVPDHSARVARNLETVARPFQGRDRGLNAALVYTWRLLY